MENKKCIFITGAASGIGEATAKFFVKKGWFVGLYDRNMSLLAAVYEKTGPSNSCYKQLDVTNVESVREALAHFASHTGNRIDVLFNCAGCCQAGSFETIPYQTHENLTSVNVFGVLNCCYEAFSYLKNTPGSTIVNMSSGVAAFGMPDLASYTASKFWVRGFTDVLNIEWSQYDISVCDIMPDLVDTPMIRNHKSTKKIKMFKKPGMSPYVVAKTVWKASHSNKVHWKIGLQFRLGLVLIKLVPNWAVLWGLKNQYKLSSATLNK